MTSKKGNCVLPPESRTIHPSKSRSNHARHPSAVYSPAHGSPNRLRARRDRADSRGGLRDNAPGAEHESRASAYASIT
jgi:hypothetical protein